VQSIYSFYRSQTIYISQIWNANATSYVLFHILDQIDKSKQENSKLQHAIKENLEEIDNLKDEKLSLLQEKGEHIIMLFYWDEVDLFNV